MATTTLTRQAPGAARNSVLNFVARSWSYLFLIGMVLFFSIFGQGFFSVRNFSSVLVTSTLVTLIGIGQTFVIITAGIDLSLGWTVGLASVICARLMRDLVNVNGFDPTLAILFGVGGGLLVSLIPGLINGLLIARVKVPPFIATLGMFGIVRGVAFLLTDGQNVVGNLPSNIRSTLSGIGNGSLVYYTPGYGISLFNEPAGLAPEQLRGVQLLAPYPVLVTIVVILIFGFVLTRTQFGRHTYAIGGSQEASIRAGIDVRGHLIRIYMLSAFCAGIAGVLHVFRYTAGAPQAGEAQLLDSVAAVVIGGTSLFGGAGRVRGTVIGALIIGLLSTGLIILNVDSLWQFVVVGVVIIIAVLVNQAQAFLERRKA